MAPVWHGTPEEYRELATAISENCTCINGPMGLPGFKCKLHVSFHESQEFLNRMLWGRRTRDLLIVSEHSDS